MGDRAQVKVVTNYGDVYLYTHWYGHKLKKTVAKALDRGRDRWNDPEYLTRIIFSEMIKGHEKENTGFGIGVKQHSDIRKLVTVIPKMKTVTVKYMYESKLPETRSFEEFIEEFIEKQKK
jgi:hypothetical protein